MTVHEARIHINLLTEFFKSIGVGIEYTMNTLKGHVFRHEHLHFLQETKDTFPGFYVAWNYENELSASKEFANREDCIEAIKSFDFDPSIEVLKRSQANSDGEPTTTLSYQYKVNLEIEGVSIPVHVRFEYSRKGLPTTKCRVVPSIVYDVVCDLQDVPD